MTTWHNFLSPFLSPREVLRAFDLKKGAEERTGSSLDSRKKITAGNYEQRLMGCDLSRQSEAASLLTRGSLQDNRGEGLLIDQKLLK